MATTKSAVTQPAVAGDSAWGVARQYGALLESRAESNRLSILSSLRAQTVAAAPPRQETPASAKTAASPPALVPLAKTAAQPGVADVQPAKASVQPVRPASGRADPAGATVAHVVVPDETPWKIAAAYGVPVEDVLAHNRLREGDVIKPGQRLMIPTRPTAPVPRHRERAASQVRTDADPPAPVPEPGTVAARKGAVKPPAQVGPDRVFLWPTRGIITSRFGWRRYRRHHEGIDLAAPHGTPIYATRDGIVEYSGVRNGYGQVVYVDHGGGLVTVYGHASELLVAAGQRVKRGQMIARVGCTGVCTGAHVHFEVRINGVAVNPLQYLR